MLVVCPVHACVDQAQLDWPFPSHRVSVVGLLANIDSSRLIWSILLIQTNAADLNSLMHREERIIPKLTNCELFSALLVRKRSTNPPFQRLRSTPSSINASSRRQSQTNSKSVTCIKGKACSDSLQRYFFTLYRVCVWRRAQRCPRA